MALWIRWIFRFLWPQNTAAQTPPSYTMPPIILYKLLQHAILDGDLPLVKKIMLRNCVQDIPDPATGAPLCFFAIRTGQTEILAYLVSIKRDNRIDKVSSIYAGFQRNTALMACVVAKNYAVDKL